MHARPPGPLGAARLAEWIGDFAASPMPPATAARARLILLDTLACALYAANDDKAAHALATARKLGGTPGCTIIGTRLRTALPQAALVNGVLLRTLNLTHPYPGPRQIGHPSDNIGAALAAAEVAGRSGAD